VISVNYTINTLEQIKPILIGFRKVNGLSQKALAEKLGISQQSYQALESAPQKATIQRLFKVLSMLGVKLQLVDNNTPAKHPFSDGVNEQDEW
jgi:HTH-type transcriptional regulator/antitoxin HipB